MNNVIITIENSPARNDYRRNDIGLLICNAEGDAVRFIYTKPLEQDIPMSDNKEINPVEIVAKYYAPIVEIQEKNERVYLGMFEYGKFYTYAQVL